MATPSEKLADSLEVLHKLQKSGAYTIRASEITRTHRERLLKNGFLQEVIQGWYIPIHPRELPGDSTAWYAAFWNFFVQYLNYRFGSNWCLSPEQSLLLHADDWSIPQQLSVRTLKGGNKVIKLPFGTSLFDVRHDLPESVMIVEKNGLRIYVVESALVACSVKFFTQHPIEARTILLHQQAAPLLKLLLSGGHSSIAGRLAGAFRNIGRGDIADEIINVMKSVGYDLREKDPFLMPTNITILKNEVSPRVNRMRIMWHEMREHIIKNFPKPPGLSSDVNNYLKQVEEIYVTDAYHSLSIEGYHVSRALIERIRSGGWNPDRDKKDKGERNALAARGYWQAFQAVKKSLEYILKGENSGEIAKKDHGTWYQQLFGPSIVAGILEPGDLAGYRNGPVYIRNAMHVPPNHEAVYDLMPEFFELLKNEEAPAARVVLGHFFFVYIHPYMDGNGRMGRFLMNTMLASGGYSWTIIPVERRTEYMASLEAASVDQDIEPFCKFLASLV